jgi:hypothetical protein
MINIYKIIIYKITDFLLYEFKTSLQLMETLKIVIDIAKEYKDENVAMK